MKELLDKLTPYNLFNYLLPGVLFVILLEYFTDYSFIQEDIIVGAFLYYFIGLIISRLGSLLLEPFLKLVRFIKFAEHKDYVLAARKDQKLDILSQENNMYRTFSSVFLLLLIFKVYELFSRHYQFTDWNTDIIIAALLVLFLFSYRKQTGYIKRRIYKVLNINE